MATNETEVTRIVEELAAADRLAECEKADLWAYAKATGLAEPSEWPGITKDALIERVMQSWGLADDSEATSAPGAVVYMGPLSRVMVPGIGTFVRGQVTPLADSAQTWERLQQIGQFIPAREEAGETCQREEL